MEEHKDRNQSELHILYTYEPDITSKIIERSVKGNADAIALYEAKVKEKEFNDIINEMDDDELEII